MAQTALTVLRAPAFGGAVLDIAPVAVDLANGNSFVNDGRTMLYVNNGSGGALTVTVSIPSGPASLGGLVTTEVYTVATSKIALIGPFPPSIFNQSTGVVNVAWSTGTSVTASALTSTFTPGF